MSLFKGTSRVASGGVDQTLNTEDLTNHTVTFVDDGDCSGYSDADEITDSISTGSQIGNLFSLIKKGLKFVSDKFSEYLPLTGGTLTGKLTIKPGSSWGQIQIYDVNGTRNHKIHFHTHDDRSTMELEVNRDGTNANRSLLMVQSFDDGSVPANVVRLANYVNGTGTTYNIWGDHNRSSMVLPSTLKMLNSEGTATQVMRLYADSESTTEYGNELLIGANGTVYLGAGESYSALYGAIGGSTSEILYLSADANIMLAPNCNTIANRKPIWLNAYQFYPATSGSHTLGTSTYKWGQIYSTASSISTSDRNQKNSIESLDDKAVQLILNVPTVSYKFNDGTSGRKHWGMIAQDVEEVMNELEISSADFAAFIKSPKEKIESEATGELVLDLDEDGNVQYEYALRYEEFIAPLIKTVQEQQKQIEALQQAVINLGGQV